MPPFAEPYKTRLRLRVWGALLLLLLIIGTEVLLRSNAKSDAGMPAPDRLSVQYPVMGTAAAVTLYGGTATAREAAAKTVAQTFRSIEKLGSLYDPESELSRLNASAYAAPFSCSESMWQILSAARRAFHYSGGAFDISAKPLMDLWGFYRKNKPSQLPTAQERQTALAKVGLNKIVFDDKAHTVRFTIPGMALDLGGVAKGFAVDLALSRIDRKKISGGIINLGGNLRVFSRSDTRSIYRVGLKDPCDKKRIDAILHLQNESTATSGDYERFVTIGEKRFCHIMDPATGFPADTLHAVTVITPNALDADLFSTMVFLRGEPMAKKIAEAVPGTSFLLYSGKARRISIAVPEKKVQFLTAPNEKKE